MLRCFLTFRWGFFPITLSYVLFEFLTFLWQGCNGSFPYVIFYSNMAMQTWIYQFIPLVKRQSMTAAVWWVFYLNLDTKSPWKLQANSVVWWSLQKYLHLFAMLKIMGKVIRLSWVIDKLVDVSLAHCWRYCELSLLPFLWSKWWGLHRLFHKLRYNDSDPQQKMSKVLRNWNEN